MDGVSEVSVVPSEIMLTDGGGQHDGLVGAARARKKLPRGPGGKWLGLMANDANRAISIKTQSRKGQPMCGESTARRSNNVSIWLWTM